MSQSTPPKAKRPFNEHLAAIVASSSDAIISKTLDGIVLSWNGSAERMFGYSGDEMVGQTIRRLVPPELQGEEDEILAQVRLGEMVGTFETVRLHKDGQPIPVTVTTSPIRAPDGTIIGASSIAHDIRGLVARRNASRFAEERHRMLADNIDQLAWITDATGYIEWYNKRWYEFTGTTLEGMRGWGWEKVHHPDHLERVKQLWTDALAAGQGWEDTFPLLGADGQYRWFLSRAHPVRGDDGAIRFWFGTNTDITQQRDHETHVNLLLGEANHRAKNMLTMIQALVHRTVGGDSGLAERLTSRIAALGSNQDLLIRRDWHSAPLHSVIETQLTYVEDIRDARITIEGPEIDVGPSAVEALGLAIHELVTNAAKYGALANDVGTISISWRIVEQTGADPRLIIDWAESGGPPVRAPVSHGFGTNLLRRNVETALGATVTLDYRRAGLLWRADAPLARVIEVDERTAGTSPNA